MLPVIAIVGRPNVGKSTLFNLLTKSRAALVADLPGVTRDRQYGEALLDAHPVLLIDTGGLVESDDPVMTRLTEAQVTQAVQESDCILLVVDAKVGLISADEVIADRLRKQNKTVLVIMNKADNEALENNRSDFFRLGLGEPIAISATQHRHVSKITEAIIKKIPATKLVPSTTKEMGIKIAVIGRPNVGKSTLINRLLGEERVIVFDEPGTTRDSIYIPFQRRDQNYTLIDTAGIRRRTKIHESLEKFSIIKSFQAVYDADVVVFVMNGQEGVTDQDLRLIGLVIDVGAGLVIVMNKWDGLDNYHRERIQSEMDRKLPFVNFARRYYISALHGSGVGQLYRAIHEAYQSAHVELSTAQLTKTLEKAVEDHQPPLVKGRRVRLRYAHLGGHRPLTIIVHGKQTDALPDSYRRYLANYFQKTYDLIGVPIDIKMKTDANPYEEK